MNLEIFQNNLKEWINNNFPNKPAWQPLLGMVEEIGELSHSFLKQEQGIRGTFNEHEEKMKDAIGDIIIFLIHFCIIKNWQIEEILENTWKEVRNRDWIKNKINGVS